MFEWKFSQKEAFVGQNLILLEARKRKHKHIYMKGVNNIHNLTQKRQVQRGMSPC